MCCNTSIKKGAFASGMSINTFIMYNFHNYKDPTYFIENEYLQIENLFFR
jgi:hypothetical protein